MKKKRKKKKHKKKEEPTHEHDNPTYFRPYSLFFYHLFLIEKILI